MSNAPRNGIALLLACVLFATCAAWSVPATAPAAKKVAIEGFVYNSQGDPIKGVDVTAWVTGKPDAIKATRTDENGKYGFGIEVTAPFDISYTLTTYRTSTVAHLAEHQPQQISRILYSQKERMPIPALHAYLQSLDRIAFLASALDRESRPRFLKAFGDYGELTEAPKRLAEFTAWQVAEVSFGPEATTKSDLHEEAAFIESKSRKLLLPRK